MFKDYTKGNGISGVERQHNIMIFIGNGFDISVLGKYRSDKLVTSYSKFYDYLQYKNFNKSNLLYRKMALDKKHGKENWSDFEYSLGELVQGNTPVSDIRVALKEIQNMFLRFLNEIVTSEVLLSFSKDIVTQRWGSHALSNFLGDLTEEDYSKINFPQNTGHYHMYNYLFVNFNYTSLFDNYVYLDDEQFEPHPYKTVDTNFEFYPNPNGYRRGGLDERTRWSSFVMTDIVHPHGYQNIPRSLLFGTEDEQYVGNKELRRINKSYWAQNDQKYKSYFKDTELFVIYGTSIGITDSWWWQKIFEALQEGNSELIIYYYNYNQRNEEEVKCMFIDACKVISSNEQIAKVKDKIYVVLHNEKLHLNMFGIEKDELVE